MAKTFSGVTSKNVKVTTTTNLANKVSEYAFKIMKGRSDRAKNAAELKAREVIVKAIKGSRVYRSLMGGFASLGQGYDLQAEFGLTPSLAVSAANKMLDILKNCVVFKFDDTTRARFHELQARATVLEPSMYEEDLKSGKEFSYVSENYVSNSRAYERSGKKRTEYLIPWMEWLLNASDDSILSKGLPNISGFGITYDLSAIGLKASRSKRALMVSLTGNRKDVRAGQVKPYTMPKIALPDSAGSKNFIEDIGKDKAFLSTLGNEINKAIYKIFKPDSPLPGYLKKG